MSRVADSQLEPVILRKTKKYVAMQLPSKAEVNINSDEPDPPKMVDHSDAQRIQRARNAKKWTRKQLAAALSVNEAVIAEYETGKAVVNSQFLQKIFKALA